MSSRRDRQVTPLVVRTAADEESSSCGGKKKPALTYAALAAIFTIVAALVGFFAAYVFATKPELAQHRHDAAKERSEMRTELKVTEASVRDIKEDIAEIRIDQRLTNRNLEKLLLRDAITPASRSDIRIDGDGNPR